MYARSCIHSFLNFFFIVRVFIPQLTLDVHAFVCVFIANFRTNKAVSQFYIGNQVQYTVYGLQL